MRKILFTLFLLFAPLAVFAQSKVPYALDQTGQPTPVTPVMPVDANGNYNGPGSSNTQQVTATTLPLPTGAATSANQATQITSLNTIATNTTGAATSALQTTGNASLATIATNTTGAATSALQTNANTSLAAIATNTTGAATAANQSTQNTTLASINNAAQYWTETTGTQNLIANGTLFYGGWRDVGAGSGSSVPWAFANAWFNPHEAGIGYIQCSNDQTNIFTMIGTSVVATGYLQEKVPVYFRYCRAAFYNSSGSTQTVYFNAGFSFTRN